MYFKYTYLIEYLCDLWLSGQIIIIITGILTYWYPCSSFTFETRNTYIWISLTWKHGNFFKSLWICLVIKLMNIYIKTWGNFIQVLKHLSHKTAEFCFSSLSRGHFIKSLWGCKSYKNIPSNIKSWGHFTKSHWICLVKNDCIMSNIKLWGHFI